MRLSTVKFVSIILHAMHGKAGILLIGAESSDYKAFANVMSLAIQAIRASGYIRNIL